MKNFLIENLEFFFIQTGKGCVSNCNGCGRKDALYASVESSKIISVVERLVQEKIFSGDILLYNRDICDLEDSLLNFLDRVEHNFSGVYFHSDFRDIQKLVNTFPNRKLVYQRDIDKEGEFEKFLRIISQYKVLPPTDFTLWFSNEKIIPMLLKAIRLVLGTEITLTKRDDTNYILGYKDIKIRLYDNKKLDHKYLPTCFFDHSIKFSENNSLYFDTDIFFLNCLEITQEGDISPHEPPIGFPHISISNVFRSREQILRDFENFSLYIQQLISQTNGKQEGKCNLCRKMKYKYTD